MLYSVRAVPDYLEQAEILEAEAKKLRKKHEYVETAKNQVAIGKHIFDLEMQEIGIVTNLKNGCNDFETDFLNPKLIGRGYLYVVPNWRIATDEEVNVAKEQFALITNQ